jgi:antitoxin VapB
MPQTAKLFTNGGSQAVRLPAEFRFEGTEVEIRRDPDTGNVILSSRASKRAAWEEFMKARDQVKPEDVPEGFPWRDTRMDDDRPDPFADWEE